MLSFASSWAPCVVPDIARPLSARDGFAMAVRLLAKIWGRFEVGVLFWAASR